MAKDAMACAECDGEGCEACQGNMGRHGDESDEPNGNGHGHAQQARRRSAAGREERHEPARHARATERPAAAARVFGGMVEGPNIKGEVAEAIKEEMATLEAEPADPLTSERLPNSRREHAEQYFELLRERQKIGLCGPSDTRQDTPLPGQSCAQVA